MLKIKGAERASLYTASGAFFLSVLIGFASRNPAQIVLMRAFLSAMVFGAILYGGMHILNKYIPEIGQRAAQPAGRPAAAEELGRQVDFTVGGEAEKSPSAPTVPVGEPFEGTGAPPAAEEEMGEIAPDELKRAGGGKEDFEEVLPSLDSLFEREEEAPAGETVREPQKYPSGFKKSVSDRYITLGNARIPNEPETMAKAIKRMMKQDGTG